MSQDGKISIFAEDRHLVEKYQLGVTLSLYHVRKDNLHQLHVIGWLALILSLLTFSALIILSVINWQQIIALSAEHANDLLEVEKLHLKQEQMYAEHDALLRSLIAVGCMFLLGLFLLLIRNYYMKSERVIVCQRGLLQIRRKLGGNRIEMVRWEEIQSLELVRAFPDREYTHLIRKEGKPLTLAENYENFDELLILIRQHSQLDAVRTENIEADKTIQDSSDTL